MTALLLIMSTSYAGKPALEAQNRVHAGVSFSDGQTLGYAAGMDSRLTRLIFVDVGAWVSPTVFPDELVNLDTSLDARDYLYLRHGLYFSPGFRVPHRDGDGLQWDTFLRFGFAAVWFTDTEPEIVGIDSISKEIEVAPGAFGGLDFQLRYDRVGLKLGGKGIVSRTFSEADSTDLVVFKPQWSAEVLYQW